MDMASTFTINVDDTVEEGEFKGGKLVAGTIIKPDGTTLMV